MNVLAVWARRRSLLRSQWLDPVSIRAMQEEKLRSLIHYAYAHVPYYRETFDRNDIRPQDVATIGDLRKIPVTTKASLIRLPPTQRIGDTFRIDNLTTERTSGSTGEPFTAYFDRSFVAVRNALFLRALHVSGYRFGDRLMLITGGKQRSRPHMRWRYCSISEPAETLIAELIRFRPHVLYGCATPLRLMAEHIRDSGARIHPPRVVVSTAETLDDAGRALLRSSFRADVFDIYGLTETGFVAWECTAHDGFHLSEDEAIVELAHDEKYGAARLIVTNLALKSMPMIRFETGDLALPVESTRCGCGRSLRRIRRIEGRMVDSLRRADGTMVTPYRLTLALEDIDGLDRYQVVQEDLEQFVVRIEAAATASADLDERIRRTLASALGDKARITVRREASIAPPRGEKFRVIANLMRSS